MYIGAEGRPRDTQSGRVKDSGTVYIYTYVYTCLYICIYMLVYMYVHVFNYLYSLILIHTHT
jgi:hypothetical protein